MYFKCYFKYYFNIIYFVINLIGYRRVVVYLLMEGMNMGNKMDVLNGNNRQGRNMVNMMNVMKMF